MKKRPLSLAERMERARQEWNDAVTGLGDADFDLPVYRQWTLKDVLGHVFSYLHLALRHIRSYKKRKRLASPRSPTYSYFNRREAARLKAISLAQLRADLDAMYRDLMELLPTLTDDDLKTIFPSQWSAAKYKTSLRYQLRETAEHWRIHAADVRQWRERTGR